jgi:hypothetical protein
MIIKLCKKIINWKNSILENSYTKKIVNSGLRYQAFEEIRNSVLISVNPIIPLPIKLFSITKTGFYGISLLSSYVIQKNPELKITPVLYTCSVVSAIGYKWIGGNSLASIVLITTVGNN